MEAPLSHAIAVYHGAARECATAREGIELRSHIIRRFPLGLPLYMPSDAVYLTSICQEDSEKV